MIYQNIIVSRNLINPLLNDDKLAREGVNKARESLCIYGYDAHLVT